MEANPDLGAVLLRDRAGQDGRDEQEDQTGESADVAVTGQHPVIGEEADDEAERHHADEGPQHLLVGAGPAGPSGAHRTLGEVETMNHD